MKSPPTKSISKSKSTSKSLILSLPQNDAISSPVPLNVYDPNAPSSRRRSPRFAPHTSNMDSKSPKSRPNVVPENGLRRSPRFAPAEAASDKGRRERNVVAVDAGSLRRSPRLENANAEAVFGVSRKKRNAERGEGDGESLFEGVTLRRSPRFVPASNGAQSGESKMEFNSSKRERHTTEGVALKRGDKRKKDLHMKCLDEKFCRRSPRLSSALVEIQSSTTEAKLHLLPQISKYLEKGISASATLRTNHRPRLSRELEAKSLYFSWNADDGKCYNSSVSNEKQQRHSPRFLLPTEKDLTCALLSKTTASLSDEKKLRSLRDFSQLNFDESNKANSFSSELSSLQVEMPLKRLKKSGNIDMELLDEKLLRASPGSNDFDFGVDNDTPKELINEYSHEKIRPLLSEKKTKKHKRVSSLIGDPISREEAEERWCWRYEMKSLQGRRSKNQILTSNDDDEDKIVWNVEYHYNQAEIDGCIFNLGDCAYIKGDFGKKHVGRIVEFFKTTDGEDYFRVQWFYRAEDTVMKNEATFHDEKRLFYSTIMNDNPIDCIISKVSVVQMSHMMTSKLHSNLPCDFYFDMEYCVDYSTFRTMQTGNSFKIRDSSPPALTEAVPTSATYNSLEFVATCESYKAELVLLDLFSGCGGMSTGLCLGAKLSCVNLVTRWALDSDESACESLKLNHPETHVRNEDAEDFLQLLKEWEKLCKKYVIKNVESFRHSRSIASRVARKNQKFHNGDINPADEFEVSKLVDICYGDPDNTGKRGLKFKVRWKGYSTSEDTWEPIEGLRNCQECIRDFVMNGFKVKILPLPGEVDVICGGPPCQGISGYNRFRNVDSPLSDERNRQIVVFMDIVQFLKPKFVLMENVVDILKFDKASLGRYALSRLVHMKYQARLGTIAAGCYGLPQFRLRVFLWGAHPSEKLPQFPLPTHDVIIRYGAPVEFERNTVAYDEDQPRELENAIVLQDAISDLPVVTSHEVREEMKYEKPSETEFQKFIRASKYEMTGSTLNDTTNNLLYDHRPYSLTEDDYARLCQIPKRKGANFRDLPGVVVGHDNVARRDPTMEQIMLPSGKPLVPDFAFTYEQGKSKRPYARLWWDETVSTVLTHPDLHNQVVIHPEQDRVLTIRECARLQGFPDYYRFCGTVKKRYRQIGNAVAVPVGRALGYALGMAFQKLSDDEPLMKLPPKFSHSTNLQLAKSLFQKKE